MKKPLVSVVMPVYNSEEFLSQSVESILNQTYTNFEFLIFEDGSLDNSYSILCDYAKKDKRIKLIKRKKNKGFLGYINNLNYGLRIAKGKYVARMDADDISLPTRLEKQVNYLENHKDIFLVGSGRCLINQMGQFIGLRFGINGIDRIRKLLPTTVCIVHPSIMFCNEKGLKYRKKMFYSEDYDFYLNLISRGKKLDNLFFPLIKYRFKDKSLSRSNSYLQQLFSKKCIEFFFQRMNTGVDGYDKFNSEELIKEVNSKKVSSIYEIESNFISSNYIFCKSLCSQYLKDNFFDLKVWAYYTLSKFRILAYFSKQVVHFIKIICWFIFY